MRIKSSLLPAIIVLFSCNSHPTGHKLVAVPAGGQDSAPPARPAMPSIQHKLSATTHLKDTAFLSGQFVLFLLPDSARFEHLTGEDENVFEGDSDFGTAIQATLDSLSHNPKYQKVHAGTSARRFVVIEGAGGGRKTVDRDTVDYGVLFTTMGKPIILTTNVHSGNYLDEISEYFNIK